MVRGRKYGLPRGGVVDPHGRPVRDGNEGSGEHISPARGGEIPDWWGNSVSRVNSRDPKSAGILRLGRPVVCPAMAVGKCMKHPPWSWHVTSLEYFRSKLEGDRHTQGLRVAWAMFSSRAVDHLTVLEDAEGGSRMRLGDSPSEET